MIYPMSQLARVFPHDNFKNKLYFKMKNRLNVCQVIKFVVNLTPSLHRLKCETILIKIKSNYLSLNLISIFIICFEDGSTYEWTYILDT